MKFPGRWFSLAIMWMAWAFCVAMVLLWIRSYWRFDEFDWAAKNFIVTGYSERGLLAIDERPIYNGQDAEPSSVTPGFTASSWPVGQNSLWVEIPLTDDHQLGRLGFAINHWVTFGYLPFTGVGLKGFQGYYGLYVPHWFVVLICGGVGAAIWWRRRRVRRRAEGNICIKCGYDLRATPDRCPKCGTVVKSERAAAANQ